MFPSRALVSLDSLGLELIPDGTSPEQAVSSLPSLRTAGLLNQAKSLTAFALDIFRDLAVNAQALFARTAALQERAGNLQSLLGEALPKFNEAVSAWPTEAGTKAVDAAEVASKLGLAPSCLVETVITSASAPPNLNPFNEVEHELFPASAEAHIDFNKYFSDPKMIERQYMQELLDEMKKEMEAKKAARKAEREREKAEKKALREQRAQKKGAATDAVNQAIAAPPMAPTEILPQALPYSRHCSTGRPWTKP
jgi:hypothetical protein